MSIDIDGRKQFKCGFDNCKWSFSSRYKLERHNKTHTGVKDFKCCKCEKEFANSYSLIAHEKIHQKYAEKIILKGKPSFNPLKCPRKRCMKLFNNEEEITNHLQNHNLQYNCTEEGCLKRFAKPSLLKKHTMMVHSQERAYKCMYNGCDKGFMTMQKLKRHQLIHENKKEFMCKVNDCGRRFNCKEYLVTHQRVHQETKPLKCPLENCGKHFTCNSTLKLHLQMHANHRPFNCDNCGKTYLTASSLRTHNKKAHEFKTSPMQAVLNDDEEDDNVDVNELINLPNLDTAIMSGLVAAFGEFACNQYMNCEESVSCGNKIPSSTNENSDSGLNAFNELDKERLKDLQEEFVRNIYASSVNIDHSFLPGYSVPSESSCSTDNKSSVSTTDLPVENLIELQEKRFCNSDTILLEPSMELSTGHMEIDSGDFEASSCMPDHVYSHKIYGNISSSSSTVNVQDIH